MEVLGNGFIARHLNSVFGERHGGVTAIAAGVSRTLTVSAAEFDREATLIYEAIRHCREQGRMVVFFSTASPAMYGGPGSAGTELGPVYPTSAYGRHKLALENVVAHSRTPHLILRLAHLAGEGQQPHQLLSALISQVRSGQVTVREGARRDMLDIQHMLRSLDLLLSEGVCNEVINIASGFPEPVDNIVSGIEERLGITAERIMVPAPRDTSLVSVNRLRTLVPEIRTFGFGPGYLATLLDRYVKSLDAEARPFAQEPARG